MAPSPGPGGSEGSDPRVLGVVPKPRNVREAVDKVEIGPSVGERDEDTSVSERNIAEKDIFTNRKSTDLEAVWRSQETDEVRAGSLA